MAKKKTKKKIVRKKGKKKKAVRKKTTGDSGQPPSDVVYKKPAPALEPIFALNAMHIPHHLQDACLDIDDEFPLHYSTGIVRIEDNGNLFAEWLKTLGFKFDKSWGKNQPNFGWLAVWGT